LSVLHQLTDSRFREFRVDGQQTFPNEIYPTARLCQKLGLGKV